MNTKHEWEKITMENMLNGQSDTVWNNNKLLCYVYWTIVQIDIIIYVILNVSISRTISPTTYSAGKHSSQTSSWDVLRIRGSKWLDQLWVIKSDPHIHAVNMFAFRHPCLYVGSICMLWGWGDAGLYNMYCLKTVFLT